MTAPAESGKISLSYDDEMIKRINKIKNLGLVFSDYSWGINIENPPLPDFKRYNLFYGWTGSGKTTLSKLFKVIQQGQSETVPDIQYEIEDDQGGKYKQGKPFSKKIRVFNKDYVENNLKIQEGKANSITLVLGNLNKDLVEKIETDELELEVKMDELKKARESLEIKKKQKDQTFSQIAKTIYVAITGSAIRTYNKNNAEKDFLAIQHKAILSEEELEKFSIIVKQRSKSPIDELAKIEIQNTNHDKKNLEEVIEELVSEATQLLEQTVESQVIDRLQNNQDISTWVESGMAIHEKHKSVNCEFCGRELPAGRLAELAKHFNEADKKLKREIDTLISKLSNISSIIRDVVYPDKANFYDELQKDYEVSCEKFLQEKTSLIDQMQQAIEQVEMKKSNTTKPKEFNTEISLKQFSISLEEVASFIMKHNQKTADFETEKNKVIVKLKTHYLSTIFDEIKNLEEEIIRLNQLIDRLNKGNSDKLNNVGIEKLKKRIFSNQAKVSSTHKACEDINEGLATFLGHDELVFEPHKEKIIDENGIKKETESGYVIKRSGKIAENLSDGEKTAIAFVHFTIHLQEDFDLENGIVVIDDPVSSLDSNSLFQAFSRLQNSVKDGYQVFIFTHNFEFLKLLLNWFRNADRDNPSSSYYMIKNYYPNGARQAFLDRMDKELFKYESEYHYLFKKLYEFKSNQTIAQAYPIPNMARKVLDTFLLFRVPSGEGVFRKLEEIRQTTSFDPNKLTAIYKFVNDQSHITGSGFDPSLVPETQKSVKYLLKMIEEVSPEHYKILKESISTQ